MAKSFPCQIQKMKVETIHPFKVRSVRFVVVSESLQISFLVACSKRSDSGERCEVKKAIKSRGGLGREVRERL